MNDTTSASQPSFVSDGTFDAHFAVLRLELGREHRMCSLAVEYALLKRELVVEIECSVVVGEELVRVVHGLEGEFGRDELQRDAGLVSGGQP